MDVHESMALLDGPRLSYGIPFSRDDAWTACRRDGSPRQLGRALAEHEGFSGLMWPYSG